MALIVTQLLMLMVGHLGAPVVSSTPNFDGISYIALQVSTVLVRANIVETHPHHRVTDPKIKWSESGGLYI